MRRARSQTRTPPITAPSTTASTTAVWLALLLAVALLGAGTWIAPERGAAAPPEPTRSALRIGTSGDYPPFTRRLGEGRDGLAVEGFEAALAEAWAAERGIEIEWVPFRWPGLLEALAAGRFDVAMSGVTVRPERAAVGRYCVATVESQAVALVREPTRRRSARQLNRPDVRIGVNAGGHLERVARASFPRATLLAVPDNASVLEALRSEAVDAVVTETHEARLWQESVRGSETIGPLALDRKAWLVRAERGDLAADLDAWLLAREADGTLQRLRAEHLGTGGVATAEPLRALLAAIDERLSLMPLVGAAKRAGGLPLEVPEREQVVLDAAARAVQEAAEAAGRPAPDPRDVRRFFRAQMEAAKQVQWAAVKDRRNPPQPPLPDLDGSLRPGLLRVGERIARLLVRLPKGASASEVRALAETELRAPYLSSASRRELADAVARLVSAAGQPGTRSEPRGARARRTSRVAP